MKKQFFTILVGSMFATPAAAQTMSADFSGLRAEVIGGYDIVEIEIDELGSDDEGDIMYGIALGYDFDMGAATFGIEAEIADSSLGAEVDYVGDFYGYDADGTLSFQASRDIYVGARLAGPLSDAMLVYAKAGYTNAGAKFTAEGTLDGEFYSESEKYTFDGYRIGVGAEYRLSAKTYAKVEYRYSDYGDGEAIYDGDATDIGEVFEYGDLTRHQLVAGLGVRF